MPNKPTVPEEFLERVEFRDAAMLSFVTSGIIVPAYDAVKRDFGIIRAEYLLLLCLAHFPVLTAQDVSRLTGRPRNSISRAVHRMLKEGYLTRVPDPDDKRQAKLAITDAGRAMHDQVATYLVEKETEILNVLDQKERAQLVAMLRKLVAHVADLQR